MSSGSPDPSTQRPFRRTSADGSAVSAGLLPLTTLDQCRADVWALMGALLLRPTAPMLDSLAHAPALPGESTLARAWRALTLSARTSGPEAVLREHADLFEAVGTPRIDPYASLYLGHFLMDRPLARLRADLERLGLVRQRGSLQTEDHLGALCETMRVLIAGEGGLPRTALSTQRRFFTAHLLPWSATCLNDIARASGANFHGALARFFLAFMQEECDVLALEAFHPPELHDVLPA